MTSIEWTEQTWNPVVGCSIVSPGCTHCYAMRQAARIEKMLPALEHYRGLTKVVNGSVVWTGKVALAPAKTLLAPLQCKAATMYFVNSMSDLFHEDVPVDYIICVLAVMALTKRHTYQGLTKRAARMREVLSDPETPVRVFDAAFDIADAAALLARQEGKRPAWNHRPPESEWIDTIETWPLPNVWLGVSAERQQEAEERIPDLLATPAAVRFLSAEPLLGPIDLERIRCPHGCRPPDYCNRCDPDGRYPTGTFDALQTGLSWVICGGESGPKARPMRPDWARSLRDQCTAAGVPFFFKQWGAHAPASVALPGDHLDQDADVMCRVGKKAAGRLLDGREWNEMPVIARKEAAA